MLAEAAPGIKPVKLYNVAYSPNPEAYTIERNLEIPYPIKPLKALTGWGGTRASTLSFSLLLRGHLKDALAVPVKSARKSFYLATVHSFFVRDTFPYAYYYSIDRHENMHGWTALMNRDFREKKLNQQRLVLTCIDEGIAEWGAKEVTLRVNDPRENYDNPFTTSLPSQERFSEFLIPGVQKNVEALSAGLNLLSLMSFDKLNRYVLANNTLNELSYETGLYFVSKIIEYLKTHGTNENEALIKLVKNPPSTVDQLKDPLEFAEELLSI